MTKSSVELRNVSFTYAGFDAPAVDDVSFAVAPGECVVLCGESGCGKTTATRIVNGLAGGFYEGSRTGKVLVAGRDVDDLEDWELSSLTGSVFQNPSHPVLQPRHDRRDRVRHGEPRRSQGGDARAGARRRARARHGECLMGRGIFELSGGQMQSVAFASAWACRPSVYVLDEPSSNLDPPSMEKLASFISKAKSSGSAVIIAEHRLSYLARRRRPVPALRRRFRRRRMGRAAIPGAARLRARVLRAQILRAAEARRPDAAPFPSRLRLSRRRGEGNLCGVREGCAGPRGDYRLVRPREGRRRGRAKRGRQVNPAQVPGGDQERRARACPVPRLGDPSQEKTQSCVSGHARPRLPALSPERARRVGIRGPVFLPIADEPRLEAVLEAFGLGDVADRHPASLSGGQKQRCVCAIASESGAQALLLDEPTSGLDFRNMERLALILREEASRGKTVAVVSHDTEFLSKACDQIVLIE